MLFSRVNWSGSTWARREAEWVLRKQNPLEIRFHSLSFASLPLFFWHLRQFKDYEFNNFGWFSAFETKWIGFVDFSTEKKKDSRGPSSSIVSSRGKCLTIHIELVGRSLGSLPLLLHAAMTRRNWKSRQHILLCRGVLNVMKNLHRHSGRVWSDQRTNCLNEVDRANLRN